MAATKIAKPELDRVILEHVSCNLCGSKEVKPFREVRDRFYHTPGEFIVAKCNGCGLIYLNPRPTRSSIDCYYPTGYFAYSPPQDLPVRTDFSGSRGWLRSRIFVTDSWLGFALHTWFVRWKTNWRWFYAAHPGLRGGRILDVGCGSGQTLLLFRKFGWETYGIDISKHAVDVAAKSGLHVIQGEIADGHFPENYFDLVWLSHVFEHVHDPTATLGEVHRILKANGIAFIEIPVIDSLLPALFGGYYYCWECPRHLYHFSKRTLLQLSQDCGFGFKVLARASNAWILSMSVSYVLEELFPSRAECFRKTLSVCEGKPWLWIVSIISVLIRMLGQGEVLFVQLRKVPEAN